jgi:hypothetical protein
MEAWEEGDEDSMAVYELWRESERGVGVGQGIFESTAVGGGVGESGVSGGGGASGGNAGGNRASDDGALLAGYLKATPAGQAVVWMAPCSSTFKTAVAASAGSTFVFHEEVQPGFFTGPVVPDSATTIVVSAQIVSRQFLEAWREKLSQCHGEEHHNRTDQTLRLVRRGTSLGSIDIDAAKELGIEVVNTPGVNSPHVAQFVVDTLGLTQLAPEPFDAKGEDTDPDAAAREVPLGAVKAVVVGAGSVGQSVIALMKGVGVNPVVVSRSPESPSLQTALRGATHVAVCASTSGDPIFTTAHTEELFAGDQRAVKICSVSRPEAFSLEAIMAIAQREAQAQLRFDYGDSTLAPTREKVNRGGAKANVTWSSIAMASQACKRDMDEAVLQKLVKQ